MPKKSKTSDAATAGDQAIPAEFKLQLNRLVKQFGDSAADEKLAARVVAYILNDTDPEVLLELGSQKELGDKMALHGLSTTQTNWQAIQNLQTQHGKFISALKDVPSAVVVRVGEVIEAIYRAAGHKATPPKGWPLWLAYSLGLALQSHYRVNETRWSVKQLHSLFQQAGLSEQDLALLLLGDTVLNDLRNMGLYIYGSMHERFTGCDQFFKDRTELLRNCLTAMSAADNKLAIQQLSQMNYDFSPLADVIATLAVSPQKTLRELATPICQRHPEAVLPHLQKLLQEGDASQRCEAVSLLYQLKGDQVVGLLQEQLARESADRVKQAIEKCVAAATMETQAEPVEFTLKPIQVETGIIPLGEPAKAGLRSYFDRCHDDAMKQFVREEAAFASPDRPKWMRKPSRPEPLPDSDFQTLIDFVEGRNKDQLTARIYNRPFTYTRNIVDESFAPPHAKLIHVVRLAAAMHYLTIDRSEFDCNWYQHEDLDRYRELCPEPFGLREVDAAVASLPKGKPGQLLMTYLESDIKYHEFCNWEPEAIWPAFAENLELLRGVITGTIRRTGYDYRASERRKNGYRVLSFFPQLPPGFVNLLWDIALGESKTERPLAQQALRQVPDKAKKIAASLTDGRQAIRQAAADWIAKLGEPTVLAELKTAFLKEKQEVVKGSLITALEKCGADVTEFMDRKQLGKEAEAGLKKKIPAALNWFPFDSLPKLHWQDNGEQVAPAIVKWWIVQAVTQKSAVPGPLSKRYLQMCKPSEVADLAKFILSSWISYDTRTATTDEAQARAKTDAAQQWKMYGKSNWFAEMHKSEQGLQETLFRQYMGQLIGSASGERGMLALVAVNTPVDCIRLAEQYIKKWFGQRLAQCKALVEMLANVAHPMALQVLLGIANRFRTKAIRDLAKQHVEAIAEREGWTLDQLADRTIPDAGFVKPEGGGPATLIIDYGPRQFTVTLDDELEVIIQTDAGKTIKALPAPGKGDDAEIAKEAKKSFSDAKKQAKDVVKRQRERLYEAICVQRGWNFADWKLYLADHPIVGRLCVRVVWAVFAPGEEGAFLGCFRPLEDGSLSNETDDTVSFPDDALVRVAHSANIPAELAAAWAQHLKDYDVEPLFDQFGREPYHLPADKQKEKEITAYQGHCLRNFQLRGKATKLGYQRGDAEDGGWFTCYRKPFPSLGIEAEIGFSGSPLPEEDFVVALHTLSFNRLSANENASSWNRPKVELGKIPSVLLTECYNDVKQIAAEGTGFNPDWEKVGYC